MKRSCCKHFSTTSRSKWLTKVNNKSTLLWNYHHEKIVSCFLSLNIQKNYWLSKWLLQNFLVSGHKKVENPNQLFKMETEFLCSLKNKKKDLISPIQHIHSIVPSSLIQRIPKRKKRNKWNWLSNTFWIKKQRNAARRSHSLHSQRYIGKRFKSYKSWSKGTPFR